MSHVSHPLSATALPAHSAGGSVGGSVDADAGGGLSAASPTAGAGSGGAGGGSGGAGAVHFGVGPHVLLMLTTSRMPYTQETSV